MRRSRWGDVRRTRPKAGHGPTAARVSGDPAVFAGDVQDPCRVGRSLIHQLLYGRCRKPQRSCDGFDLDEFRLNKPERLEGQQRHRDRDREAQDGRALVDRITGGTDLSSLVSEDRVQLLIGVGYPLSALALIPGALEVIVRATPRPVLGRLRRPQCLADLAKLCGSFRKFVAHIGCERKTAGQAIASQNHESCRDDRRRPRLAHITLGQTHPVPHQTGLRPMIALRAAFNVLGYSSQGEEALGSIPNSAPDT
jgi:hypothetical protein